MRRRCRALGYPRSNGGAALLLAMVFMLMLALIATTSLRTGSLQLRMAGNDQFLEEAFHQAQAVVTELALEADNFPLGTVAGDVICPQASAYPACDLRLLPLPRHAQVAEGVALDYRITRQQPHLWRGFPIREAEGKASSSIRFDAAMFEIDVRVDGRERKLGSAQIVQGVAVRVPALR